MSTINYDLKTYNTVVNQKTDNESYITELYSKFNVFTFDEKKLALDIIEQLKKINIEYEKYIIVYNKLYSQNKKSNSYVVIDGDTLPRIAQNLYGDFRRWSDIYNFNNLSDLLLNPGDTLLIPE